MFRFAHTYMRAIWGLKCWRCWIWITGAHVTSHLFNDRSRHCSSVHLCVRYECVPKNTAAIDLCVNLNCYQNNKLSRVSTWNMEYIMRWGDWRNMFNLKNTTLIDVIQFARSLLRPSNNIIDVHLSANFKRQIIYCSMKSAAHKSSR